MTTKHHQPEDDDRARHEGFYEAYMDDVLETYVGPGSEHCIFLVMQRTSGQRFAVKLKGRALDALEKSLAAARKHLVRCQGVK